MYGSGHRPQRLPLLRMALACLLLASLPGVGSSAAPNAGRGSAFPAGQRVLVQLGSSPLLATELPRAAALASDRPAEARALQEAVGRAITAAIGGARVEAAFALAFNGLAVRLPRYDAATEQALLAIPGVRAVYPEGEFRLAAYESLEILGAPAFWQALGGQAKAGEGVRIAVLDSGIAIDHPMFDPSGWSYPPGYPLGSPLHTSPKVIVARAYVRPEDPPLPGEATPMPGAAGSPHGTHAAALAAGNSVTVTLDGVSRSVSGVAPGAYLMNYRVFYPSASDGVERAYTTEILLAIEDAIRDGAQVLYNGWSGEPANVLAAGPLEEALRAAAALGIIVVAPAGNDGPSHGTAGRLPGGLETPITVGVQGAPYGRALFGPPIAHDIGPLFLASVADVAPDGSPYACAPLPAGSLAGKAALVARGGCPFADKAYHVQQAGAVLALVINTEESVTDMACVGAYCAPGLITIPTAMVSKGLGGQLLAWLQTPGATPEIALGATGRVLSASPELVAPASGRGPAYMRVLKPDVTAPGVGIVAAGAAGGYLALSGSSVAAAQVAGAAAGLLQAHPAWGHREVKAALMGTARLGEPGGLPAHTGVRDRGAGLVDISRAVTATLLFDPPSLSQPTLSAGVPRETVVQVRDVRGSGAPQEWQVAVASSAGLALSAPASLIVAPGSSVPLTLTWLADPQQVGDVEAMITLEQGGQTYRLPAWGHVRPLPEQGRLLLLDNDVEFGGGFVATRPAIQAALDALGVAYDVWDADALFGAEQTLPDLEALQRYAAILWTAGEKRNPDGTFLYRTPPTARDQQLLMSYLDGGGRLLAMGQNLASATDVNPDPHLTWGRSTLYHGYLGAHWLQDDVYGGGGAPPEAVAVVGVPGSWLQGVALDLGPVGSGYGNQRSVDELGLGGSPQGHGADLVQPVAAALSPKAVGRGYVMLAVADQPTLERPELRIPYRVLHQSFGLEGVNERPGVTSAAALLRRQLDWLLDEVQVQVKDGLVGGPHTLTRLEAVAESSVGAAITGYRWRLEEGATTRLIESSGPVVHVVFGTLGEHTIAVEATDAFGHRALGEGTVRIVSGGASDLAVDRAVALPGDALVYTVTLVNSEPLTLTAAFTLPLPTGTSYQGHTGADWDGASLRWEGTLAPADTRTATLTVRVDPDSNLGAIEALAEYTVHGAIFQRRASTVLRQERRSHLPLIRR